jgi:transketolase
MDMSKPKQSSAPVTFTQMANSLRMLAADAVQKANSGHPGAPMGMAEMAVALWSGHLSHNPANPLWLNRDRFVLSNGHASMLLYGLLHLTGYDLPIDELRRFRQWGSRTPGHPERGLTPGVETTTGPLGQGLANAVGMALAEKLLADEFNRPDHPVVQHHTYAFVGDGCLMEGISHEACSLAGALELNKLIVLYDDNGISIDGPVSAWFRDDTAARFRAYGWNVVDDIDGHDAIAIGKAIALAKVSSRGPTLILCKTTIGKGSPNRAGTAKAHGEPFGADEIQKTREALGWTSAPFDMPAPIVAKWSAVELGIKRESNWQQLFGSYRSSFPELAEQFTRRMAGELPAQFDAILARINVTMRAAEEPIASRKSSQRVLGSLAPQLAELLGGSADLTGSNLTDFPGCGAVRAAQSGGRHINYGVREFAMAAIMNGIALHGGYIPYGGTFLTFSDYSRNAIRMAALMKLRVIHVLTHDSIGLGEDGPTHQPIEHVASLRLIPNLDVWRPCDSLETAVAWRCAIERPGGPSALVLSRQNLMQQVRPAIADATIACGGYVLSRRENAVALVMATGSEVELAIQAQQMLDAQGISINVVSMPCTSQFERQPEQYRCEVLPAGVPRLAIEAGVTSFWRGYACVDVIGIDHYGESAPAGELMEHFGLTAQNLVQRVRAAILRNGLSAVAL